VHVDTEFWLHAADRIFVGDEYGALRVLRDLEQLVDGVALHL
jgi:hypothetical protein